jgi:hypothetical protein
LKGDCVEIDEVFGIWIEQFYGGGSPGDPARNGRWTFGV